MKVFLLLYLCADTTHTDSKAVRGFNHEQR